MRPSIASPQKKTSVEFSLIDGRPSYEVFFKGKRVINDGKLGFVLAGNDSITHFRIINTHISSFTETWKPVWGQTNVIENEYAELVVELEDLKRSRLVVIHFRAYDDGFAFQYVIPKQKGIGSIQITSEESYFALQDVKRCWWSWADYNTLEKSYYQTPIDSATHVALPFTFQRKDGIYVSVHEAAIVDYSTMSLKQIESAKRMFKTDLVPWSDGILVKAEKTVVSPWRAFIFGEDPGALLQSNLIQNLNEPCVLKDVSWIKPMTYCGIWWEMHLGISTWKAGATHGANTENAKRYIDLAVTTGLKGVLMEGWNTGWENWGQKDAFDFTTPYPDLDLKEVVRYARSKGIEIIGHHETGGDTEAYEKRVKKAFKMYHQLGIHAVKTGYAGPVTPVGELHHGQCMVQHYNKIMRLAARYQLMLDVHEPIVLSGLSRTYPNLITAEGMKGMEWNAWSEGNSPTHTCTLPFTRGIAGPMDYTPGIFDIDLTAHASERVRWNGLDKGNSAVHSTLANQLALMIVLYSPLQMASDLPENYLEQKAAGFFKDLPANWDETRIIDAQIGEMVVVARRSGKNWYVAGITNETAKTVEIPLHFLEKNKTYQCTYFLDAPDAHYEHAPELYEVKTSQINGSDALLTISMAPGGGFACVLKTLEE